MYIAIVILGNLVCIRGIRTKSCLDDSWMAKKRF